MWLYLGHIFLDSQLFTLEKSTLLALVDIHARKGIDKAVSLTVVIITLNYYIGHCRRLFYLLFLHFYVLCAEIIRIDKDLIIITWLESESFRYDVLLWEIKCAHRPFLITFKSAYRVAIAVFHTISNISLEQIKHFQELSPNLINCLFIILILLAYFLKSIVGTELYFLSIINGLFLTNGSIEIYVLLFQCAHWARNFLHQNRCIYKWFIVFCENFIL